MDERNMHRQSNDEQLTDEQICKLLDYISEFLDSVIASNQGGLVLKREFFEKEN